MHVGRRRVACGILREEEALAVEGTLVVKNAERLGSVVP